MGSSFVTWYSLQALIANPDPGYFLAGWVRERE
jgi:hypothetical protein